MCTRKIPHQVLNDKYKKYIVRNATRKKYLDRKGLEGFVCILYLSYEINSQRTWL